MRYTGIHVWGDSILKGIVFDEGRQRYAILRENCVAEFAKEVPVPVVNHAFMGITAPEAEKRMNDADFLPGGLALIEFGGNDCDMLWESVAEAPEGRHEPKTPLGRFAESLGRMVERVRLGGMQPMLVVPPPLDGQRYFEWITQKLNKEAILRFMGDVQHIYRWQELYAFAVTEVAERVGCPLLRLRDAFLRHEDFSRLLCVDGIHPSAEGHRVMLQGLREGCGA
jgi:lysophospholipase L1-like esterase